MINRVCISINNRCNLACKYCHFHEKHSIQSAPMNIFEILDNIKDYASSPFKVGFVGNGEPFLDWNSLRTYIQYLEDSSQISCYTITNGTVDLSSEDVLFLEEHKVNVGFSIDGFKELHDKNRCSSFDKAMSNVRKYKDITGHYPTFNATVGRDTLDAPDDVIRFFSQFGTRVTFSRMIGQYGIQLDEYHQFLERAEQSIPVRRGGTDCTMYGGRCGAGTNNYFYANGNVYLCGNCVDLPPVGKSSISLYELEKLHYQFDRRHCYKESLCE